jgi:uncharacterized protein (DUF1697 family)
MKMTQYISILRGINVSGQKKIKMADLKGLYQDAGFGDVETYIQSGNVVFTSDEIDVNGIQCAIEQAIKTQYGFDVPVIVRTSQQFHKMFKALPFDHIDIANDGSQVLLTILGEVPDSQLVQSIQQFVKAPEKLVVLGDTVYLHCPNGYGKSKLSNVFIERKLAVCATTRNLKTVDKLCQIASH